MSTTALSVNYSSPVDPDNIKAFNSKYNIDISPYLAKYYTEPNLESSSKKRKDNPTSKPPIADPDVPGLASVLGTAHSIANFHMVLPTVAKLRSAIEKSTSPEPALTQAIENLVCTPRTQVRTSGSSIQSVLALLLQWRDYLLAPSKVDTDKRLAALAYATHLLSNDCHGSGRHILRRAT